MLGLKSELESGGVMVYSHWPEARPGQEPGKMGCMKLRGSFHITPEQGQGLRHIVPHCSGHSHCSCLGPSTAQCEYTIKQP